jgi:hypothetical protein
VIVGERGGENERAKERQRERVRLVVETRVLTVEEWDPDNSFLPLFPLLNHFSEQ